MNICTERDDHVPKTFVPIGGNPWDAKRITIALQSTNGQEIWFFICENCGALYFGD